jgi:hypothetical protein
MISFQFRKLAVTALVAVFTLSNITTKLWAHGFEGDRFFPPTVTTDDPFATDELAMPTLSFFNNPASSDGTTPKTREIDISTEFDKEIFPKFALGVTETEIFLKPQGQTGMNGFDNLSLSAKYQIVENAAHEFILSVGGEIDLGGSGSKMIGADSYSTYTPTLYYGKGFGDLPDSLKYLKPFAVTGTLGYAIPGEAGNSDGSLNPDVLQWGFALEYSLPYLQQHVEDIGLPHPFQDFIPLVEFSMNTPVNRGGGYTTGTINPGILWESKYCQIGAEAEIPVNSATGPNIGAVFQVQFFIDDLFPKVFGHPIFFNNDKETDK